MDSLPTGTMQSWIIVAAVAFNPAAALVIADVVGRFLRRAMRPGPAADAAGRAIRRPVPDERRGRSAAETRG
jgi:hypothetical protein